MSALDFLYLIRALFTIAQVLVVVLVLAGAFYIVDLIRAKKGSKK